MNISLHLDAIVFPEKIWATYEFVYEQANSYWNVIKLITMTFYEFELVLIPTCHCIFELISSSKRENFKRKLLTLLTNLAVMFLCQKRKVNRNKQEHYFSV